MTVVSSVQTPLMVNGLRATVNFQRSEGHPRSFPMTRFHSPCVVSYLPIQKPVLSVTST